METVEQHWNTVYCLNNGHVRILYISFQSQLVSCDHLKACVMKSLFLLSFTHCISSNSVGVYTNLTPISLVGEEEEPPHIDMSLL